MYSLSDVPAWNYILQISIYYNYLTTCFEWKFTRIKCHHYKAGHMYKNQSTNIAIINMFAEFINE